MKKAVHSLYRSSWHDVSLKALRMMQLWAIKTWLLTELRRKHWPKIRLSNEIMIRNKSNLLQIPTESVIIRAKASEFQQQMGRRRKFGTCSHPNRENVMQAWLCFCLGSCVQSGLCLHTYPQEHLPAVPLQLWLLVHHQISQMVRTPCAQCPCRCSKLIWR